MRIIVCAALKYNITIFCGNSYLKEIIIAGARHFDSIMIAQIKAIGLKGIPEQGFIDQFGTFVDRKEAMEIVKKSGQPFDIKRNGVPIDELFSEGLY